MFHTGREEMCSPVVSIQFQGNQSFSSLPSCKKSELSMCLISLWERSLWDLRHHKLFLDYMPTETCLLTHLVQEQAGNSPFTEVLYYLELVCYPLLCKKTNIKEKTINRGE